MNINVVGFSDRKTDVLPSLSVDAVTRKIGKLVHSGLVAQQSALVTTAQVSVDTFYFDSGVNAIPLAATQRLFKENARHYLDDLLPRWVSILGRAAAVCDQMSSFEEALSSESDSTHWREDLQEIFESMGTEIKQLFDAVSANRDAYPAFTKNINDAFATFSQEIDKRVLALSGEGGAISKTKKDIEDIKEDLARQLKAIVSSAEDIGEVVEKMTVDVVTKFAAGNPANKQLASPSGPRGSTGSDGGFPISGPDFKSGITGLAEACARYKADMKKLGELYLKLHQEQEMLAIAIAVQGQTKALVEDIGSVGDASTALAEVFKEVQDNFAATDRILTDTSLSDTTVAEIRKDFIREADTSWSELKVQLVRFERAIAGVK